ncbi:MAG: tyrosine-type recombinase/integrase [Gammaproteobacteria bacterium]|jgi:integrase|nr:tyrosine-type recombinase/integrase [Gammaproteobacteria bacterium]
MATFRKRSGGWRAELCIKGNRTSATFTTKREAQAWAAEEETRLREDSAGKVPKKAFRDLLDRYSREVSSQKRGARREQKMINVILRDPVAEVSLRTLGPPDIAEWRDRRLKQVSGSTVAREMTILRHACSIARREWGWMRVNPVDDVRRPVTAAARTRRPTDEETEKLLDTLGYSREAPPKTASSRVGAAYLFAIETAMRAGEICSLEWQHVNERHVHLPLTKNGYARDVPLSAEARRIIEQLRSLTGDDGEATVFNVSTASLDALFRKARARAQIEDLHFHDTRREALTRLSKIFDVMELARISGHRELRILQNVYYAPTVNDLAAKLD